MSDLIEQKSRGAWCTVRPGPLLHILQTLGCIYNTQRKWHGPLGPLNDFSTPDLISVNGPFNPYREKPFISYTYVYDIMREKCNVITIIYLLSCNIGMKKLLSLKVFYSWWYFWDQIILYCMTPLTSWTVSSLCTSSSSTWQWQSAAVKQWSGPL